LKGLILKGHHYEGIHDDLSDLRQKKADVKSQICDNQNKLGQAGQNCDNGSQNNQNCDKSANAQCNQ